MVKEIPQIPINEPIPVNRRIAWWFENTIVRSLLRILNRIMTPIRNILSFSITDFIEEFETQIIPWYNPLAQEILAADGIPEYIKYPIRKSIEGTSQVGIAGIAILVAVGYQAISSGFSDVLGRIMRIWLDRKLRSNLFDPATALLLLQRGFISQDYYNQIMAANGVRNQDMALYSQLRDRTFDETTLTQAFWRENMNQASVTDKLAEAGMSSEEIQHWFKAREVIPSPQDLIAMAVREAFNDNIAAQFGYDEGFPGEAAQWAKRQGMDEIWFKRAWRAHWVLPGLTQVREMYHRQIINDSDVESFLIAADIPSFWRNSIKQWMFREVTRVDLRRMYDLGVITAQEVYTRYLKIGYTPEDAGKLTEWTVKQYHDKERQLTKTDILNMYEDGVLNQEETSAYLAALDFNISDITLLMIHRDLRRQEKWEKQIISNVRKLFIEGIYNRTDVFGELGRLDTPGTYIEQTLQVWDLEKKAKIRIPSVTQLRDMAQAEIISITQFRDELINKGYPDNYINWYISLWLE
jgi:hypothetical protein